MTTPIKHVIDHRAHDQDDKQVPLKALDFTPEQTPDFVRAWLALQRFDREQQTRERTGE